MANVRVTFDGRNLTIIENNIAILTIPAISGRLGYQSPKDSNLKDVGTIPQGSYVIRQDGYQNIDDISLGNYLKGFIGRGAWPGVEDSWGRERIWLQPTQGTETYGRSGFSIHGGASPGSAGCIDLVEMNSVFFDIIQGYHKDITLEVNYGNYDGSTHPFLGKIEEYKVVSNKLFQEVAHDSGLTVDKLFSIAGNADWKDRVITGTNGGDVYLAKQGDKLYVTAAEDKDFFSMKYAHYNPEDDNPSISFGADGKVQLNNPVEMYKQAVGKSGGEQNFFSAVGQKLVGWLDDYGMTVKQFTAGISSFSNMVVKGIDAFTYTGDFINSRMQTIFGESAHIGFGIGKGFETVDANRFYEYGYNLH